MTCLVVGDIYLWVTYYSLSAGIEGWIPSWASDWVGAVARLLHLPSPSQRHGPAQICKQCELRPPTILYSNIINIQTDEYIYLLIPLSVFNVWFLVLYGWINPV